MDARRCPGGNSGKTVKFMANGVGNFAGRPCERAVPGQLFFGRHAPGYAHETRRGVACDIQIRIAVTHHDHACGRGTVLQFQQRRGIGFYRYAVAFARNGIKEGAKFESIDDLLDDAVGLVAENGGRTTAGTKIRDGFPHAGIDAGAIGGVGGVVFASCGENAGMVVVVCSGQGALDEFGKTVADESHDGRQVMLRHVMDCEGMVHRGGDIGKRVDESAVEIKNDKVVMQDRNSARESLDPPLSPAETGDFCGAPLVDESEILSPGFEGRVFNPIVVAEFRRWRAKPFTYLGIVLLTLLGIVLLYLSKSPTAPFGLDHPVLLKVTSDLAGLRARFAELFGTGRGKGYADRMVDLVFRPSTILPLLMVWRALISFRDAGLYRPFRTTFLTPAEFLWGMIAVPFFVSALLLVVYTGGVLAPGIMESYARVEAWQPHPMIYIAGILFEGSLNGALICFVALFFALWFRVRWSTLVPVVAAILLMQGLQVWFMNLNPKLVAWVAAQLTGGIPGDPFAEPTGIQNLASRIRTSRHLFFLYSSGLAKLVLCIPLWALCKIQLVRMSDEKPKRKKTKRRKNRSH